MVRLISLVMAWLMAASLTAPAAGQSIGDFDKISRVGGFRNFILNPSAQFHTIGVTTSNATATRSTTTPVGEGGTEYNVTITSANGYVDFNNSGATTANLGGAKCEASMRARGFQATSLFQVVDGGTPIHSVPIGVLATAQYVTINFDCPANPSALKTRITDTSTLAATNEVADSYLGRSRNVGTVAQAEHVGTLIYPATTNCQWSNTSTYPNVQGYAADTDCGTPTVTGSLTAPGTKIPGFVMNVTPGRYQVRSQGSHYSSRSAVGDTFCTRFTDGTTNSPLQCATVGAGGATVVNTGSGLLLGEFEYTSPGTVTIQVQGGNDGASTFLDARAQPLSFTVSKLPTSASAVVIPAHQNVYGVRKWDGNQGSPSRNTNAYLGFSDATLASNVTNTGSATACTSSSNLCLKIPGLPPGEYRADITATMVADAGTICTFGLSTTNSSTGLFTTFEVQGDAASNLGWSSHAHGFFTVSAQADTEIYLLGNRISGNVCVVSGGSSSRRITMSVTPANRAPTNHYVQAPVRGDTSGVAPGSSSVGFVVDGTVSEANAVTTSGSTCGTLAIPSAGTWDVRWQTKSVNSSSPSGVVRVHARVTTDVAYSPTVSNAFVDGLNGGLMNFNVAAGTTDGTMGGEFTVTTAAAATYYTRVAWSGNTGGSMGVRCPMQAVRRN